MAKMLADGNVKVAYVPTIADISAPTATELNAGTDLECLITADGLSISVDEAVVALPALCETFDAESPGRAKYAIDLTAYRHSATVDDVAWTLLLRGLSGFLAVRYGVDVNTAWTAAQNALVFPGTAGERKPNPTTANGGVTFGSRWYVTEQPELDAVVAA
jgi:hypothetical protein